MRCADCRWYVKSDIGQGECRRRPPTLVMQPVSQYGQVGFVSVFVPVKGEFWCGEWERAVQTEGAL